MHSRSTALQARGRRTQSSNFRRRRAAPKRAWPTISSSRRFATHLPDRDREKSACHASVAERSVRRRQPAAPQWRHVTCAASIPRTCAPRLGPWIWLLSATLRLAWLQRRRTDNRHCLMFGISGQGDSRFALMKRTTDAVSAAVRSATVPLGGPSIGGDQPTLRTVHGPGGSAASSISAILATLRLSMRRRVSVWQLMQSVLKKWLRTGSAIRSSVAAVEADGLANRSAVDAPLLP